MVVSKCECGKRKSKDSRHCRDCDKARREARYRENRAILDGGKCPVCGRSLRYNASITGWWQCEQLGAEGFRADASLPSCNFQMFVVPA